VNDRRLPERTAAIVCRRAGLAVHGNTTYANAAEQLFALALDVAVGAAPEAYDVLLDELEDQLTRLRRARRLGLRRGLELAHGLLDREAA
jgi:hypothetical protein